MTHDEATAALAADPAALVWAGRDFDDLAAMLKDPEGLRVVTAARAAIANAADMPMRLAAVREGIASVSGRLADREKERKAVEAFIAERDRAEREAHRVWKANQARSERVYRATHPALQALHSRVTAAERAILSAASPADIEAALAALGADFRDSAKTFREIGASIFGQAA